MTTDRGDALPKLREWNFAGERADHYRLMAGGCLLATWDAVAEHNALVRYTRAMSAAPPAEVTRKAFHDAADYIQGFWENAESQPFQDRLADDLRRMGDEAARRPAPQTEKE